MRKKPEPPQVFGIASSMSMQSINNVLAQKAEELHLHTVGGGLASFWRHRVHLPLRDSSIHAKRQKRSRCLHSSKNAFLAWSSSKKEANDECCSVAPPCWPPLQTLAASRYLPDEHEAATLESESQVQFKTIQARP